MTGRNLILALSLALSALATACTPTPRPDTAVAAPAEVRAPVTILVSIDGFRADYLGRGVTPTLSALAAGGAQAAMIPSFPSKTFPNHWALVTGDYPDHNGITANKMLDAARPNETFTMATDDPFWWNAAEPIWVTAEKAGIRTATMFWPGSNVPWGAKATGDWHNPYEGGTRPTDWQQFNMAVTGEQRVNAVLDWLRRPADIRPKFVTLYFDTVDSAGHSYGPDDARTTQAVAEVDRQIGMLVAGLKTLGQPANLIIVADHGMAQTSSDRVIAIDALLKPDWANVVETGPYASFAPLPGHEKDVAAALLKPHDHMQCWNKADIPARLHYGTNPRIPPIFCLAETGWSINPSAPTKPFIGGNHGYDNRAPEMAALFIANGPALRSAVTLEPFENVDVEPLMRKLLGLPPASGIDGTLAPLEPALATP